MISKRLLAATHLDLVGMLRNRTVLYVLVAPLLMAVGFRALLPVMSEVRIELLVPRDLPAPAATALARYVSLRTVPDDAAVAERVSRSDEALGVRHRDGRLEVVRWGDEREAMVDFARAAVAQAQGALEGRAAGDVHLERFSGAGDALAGWQATLRATLGLFGVFIGMFAVGFGVMEDKARRTFAALAVSPVSRGEYFGAKSLAAGGLTAAIALAVLPLAGGAPDWGQALVVALAAVPVAVALGLLLGLLSGSDVQLVTYAKAMSLLLVAPVAARLLPEAWQAVLWWMPTYWLGRGFAGALGPEGWAPVLTGAGVAAALGAAGLLVAGSTVVRRLSAT